MGGVAGARGRVRHRHATVAARGTHRRSRTGRSQVTSKPHRRSRTSPFRRRRLPPGFDSPSAHSSPCSPVPRLRPLGPCLASRPRRPYPRPPPARDVSRVASHVRRAVSRARCCGRPAIPGALRLAAGGAHTGWPAEATVSRESFRIFHRSHRLAGSDDAAASLATRSWRSCARPWGKSREPPGPG